MKFTRWDIRVLRSIWAERAEAAERAKQSIDTRGMTRPLRDRAERAWLEAHGLEGPFLERPPVSSLSVASATQRLRRRR